MLETSKIILKDNTRDLIKKIKEAPILYFIFTVMMIFSILIFAFATFFLLNIETNLNVSLSDVFFTVFFVFFMKSAADVYNHFILSSPVSYSLSTQVSQKKTVFEIFIAILTIELVIWFAFSSFFLAALAAFGINIYYPLEYLLFTIGVITAACIGCAISINFFSPKRYRLLPTLILLGFILNSRNMIFASSMLPLAALHAAWSIKNSIPSYQFVKRKERLKERAQVKVRSVIKALFYRETTVLWRDRLLPSFVFSSVSTGLFAGYLFLHGEDLLIPEVLRKTVGSFIPSMFVFLGVYVVVVYTAVFPGLNLFLNEEKTMWIVRHVPVKNDVFIYGKTSALALCFLASIPFVPYISIFIGLDQIVFIFWLLIFSYIAGVIVSVPLGVKYVGKKSDIMLLYSVAMLLFAILGTAATLGSVIRDFFPYPIAIYVLIIIVELLVLYLSLKLSARILALNYP